jgi:hypothetical protein
MIKKILFSSLQRFDLKDANELQQGVLDKLEYTIKLGSPITTEASTQQSYPITGVSFSGNSNGELIPSGPFAVITNTDDIIVITQEDIDAGLCTWNYASVYAAYQDGVRSGSNPTGVYFYAYPVYEDTDVENREFYSLIDGAPFTQNVSTRQRARLETFASLSSVYNIPNDEGYYPVQVAYVLAADINEAVDVPATPWLVTNIKGKSQWDQVVLPNSVFTTDSAHPNYGSTDVTTQGVLNVDLDTHASTRDKNLYQAFERIERELLRIKSYGSSDPTSTAVQVIGQKNLYSLQGLKKEIELSDTKFDNKKSFAVALKYARTGNDRTVRAFTDVAHASNVYGNEIDVEVKQNYLSVFGQSSVPTSFTALPYTTSEDTLINTTLGDISVQYPMRVLSNIHIKLPSTYAGWAIDNLDVNYLDKYAHNITLGDTGHFVETTGDLSSNLDSFLGYRRYVDTDSFTFDKANTITNAPAYVLNSNGTSSLNNDIGINLNLVPFGDLYNNLTDGESFVVFINCTLRKRNNA